MPASTELRSHSLAGPSELVLLMPIKQGLVDCQDTVTYLSRLKTVAQVFDDLRRASRESRLVQPFSDVVDRIRTIHGVHIAVVDTRRAILAVSFDQAWEPYIRVIWKDIGRLLDTILCNCEGYSGVGSTEQGYEQFVAWIRKYQIESSTFYLTGSRTVSDVLILEQMERRVRRGETGVLNDLARMAVETPEMVASARRSHMLATEPGEFYKLGVKAIYAFHSLTSLYPQDSYDHQFLIDTARQVLSEFPPRSAWAAQQPALAATFAAEIDWFERYVYARTYPAPGAAPESLSDDDVQGGILRSYEANYGCLMLFSQESPQAARQFLRDFRAQVTTGAHESDDGIYRNLAFTFQGLQRLGADDDLLAAMPKEFREGMSARAGLIGDIRGNHPDQWRLPPRNWPGGKAQRGSISLDSVDLLVTVRLRVSPRLLQRELTQVPEALAEVERIASLAARGYRLLSVQAMHKRPGGKEHFGFKDGISQPAAVRMPKDPWEPDDVALGELFLGYANDHGDTGGAVPGLLKNGTFMVVRKLQQDVGAFRERVGAVAAALGWREELVYAKLMGRWRSGHSLTRPRVSSTSNNFSYAGDPVGEICPLQSHVRRANPRRVAPTPRIVRRGMSYGPDFDTDPEADRGLMFVAYNASLAEQFEVIQRWVAGGNSNDQFSGQDDPVLGVPQEGVSRDLLIPTPRGGFATLELGDKPFVTLEWGIYAFVPALRTLDALIRSPAPGHSDAQLVQRGKRLLLALDAVRNPAERFVAFKQVLEERDTMDSGDTDALWAAIRVCHDGVYDPGVPEFGVLVGGEALVNEVLGDGARFSVSAYRERLPNCLGDQYLALDPPMHGPASAAANGVLRDVRLEPAFQCAFQAAEKLLAQLGLIKGDVDIPLPKYVDLVLATVSRYWLGIPDQSLDPANAHQPFFVHAGGSPLHDPLVGVTEAHCPLHILSTSRYVFQPAPTQAVEKAAVSEGRLLRQQVQLYVANARMNGGLPRLAARLVTPNMTDDQAARMLLAALLGFLPTVQGNALTVLREWIRTTDFWRIQDSYLRAVDQSGSVAVAAMEAVMPEIEKTLRQRQVPWMIHRTATQDLTLGGVAIAAGTRVSLGLGSAVTESGRLDPMFGGAYGLATHACPGREMGLGSLLGLVTALLNIDVGTLRSTPSDLALRVQLHEASA
ncbi:MAG: Dyp-type peroxidase [Pseudomonadales bacterium]